MHPRPRSFCVPQRILQRDEHLRLERRSTRAGDLVTPVLPQPDPNCECRNNVRHDAEERQRHVLPTWRACRGFSPQRTKRSSPFRNGSIAARWRAPPLRSVVQVASWTLTSSVTAEPCLARHPSAEGSCVSDCLLRVTAPFGVPSDLAVEPAQQERRRAMRWDDRLRGTRSNVSGTLDCRALCRSSNRVSPVPGLPPIGSGSSFGGGVRASVKPRYFDLGTALAALPLPRSGANTDIRTPPPTARQPDHSPNAVPDTDCSGDPDTVSPAGGRCCRALGAAGVVEGIVTLTEIAGEHRDGADQDRGAVDHPQRGGVRPAAGAEQG